MKVEFYLFDQRQHEYIAIHVTLIHSRLLFLILPCNRNVHRWDVTSSTNEKRLSHPLMCNKTFSVLITMNSFHVATRPFQIRVIYVVSLFQKLNKFLHINMVKNQNTVPPAVTHGIFADSHQRALVNYKKSKNSTCISICDIPAVPQSCMRLQIEFHQCSPGELSSHSSCNP